ncbi:MAG: EF-hand domain-containing protein [Roseovarius sp.]|nr:EF-hand domain-containing protein [Roseovarius sp.]
MKNTALMTGLALAIGLGALSQGRAQDTGTEMNREMGGGMADMAARFEGADTDGDGLLGPEELAARMTEQAAARIAARVERMIARHDADGDGMLSLDELQAAQGGRMFERLDADGDGMISPGEFARMREMHRARAGGHGEAMRGHHEPGGYGPHGGMRSSMMKGDDGHDCPGAVVHHHHYYHGHGH